MIDEKKCGLSLEIQEKICAVLKKYSKIQKVLLYGSRANGLFQTGSDIDLSIISEELLTKNLLTIQVEIDDLLLPYKVDISLFSQIDHLPLLEHIKKVGLEFYRKV
ncbi:MAG: nucleotidyltransferase domain-containing protein [Oligoflexales bacterium]|nr:nucleotidyltransferase domain-containing protein [Oligoflexales bacterium]